MSQLQYRYQGLRPYQTEDSNRFYGRTQDIHSLYNLLMQERLVVLFGKSGYGKSSLLNAGIVPLLLAPDDRHGDERQYRPLNVRLGNARSNDGASPLEILRRFLDRETPAVAAPQGSGESLWQHFKRRQTDDQPVKYVLIFDQFEEFFSYPLAQQQAFNEAMAELLYETVPQAVRNGMAGLPREERSRLSRPMDVRVVFSIRADRMSELDTMTRSLPAILSKRYELRALDRKQATEAIVQPALQQAGENDLPFASPAFTYFPDALGVLLQNLDRDGKGVEAFLLQVLCGFVEQRVIDGTVRDRDGDATPDVTAADLPSDFDEVFSEYYRAQLASLPVEQRHTAAALIEEELLTVTSQTEAHRISVDEAKLLPRAGVTQELLRALENTFLVRAETNSLGRRTFELSHDTLVAPVLRAYWVRQAERQRHAEEAARQAEAARLTEEAAKNAAEKRRNRLILAIGAALLLLAGVGIGVGVWQGSKASEAQVVAKQRTNEAKTAQADADRSRSAADAAQLEAKRLQHEAELAQQAADRAKADATVSKAEAEAAQAKADEAKRKADLAQLEVERQLKALQYAKIATIRSILEPHFENARHAKIDGHEVGNDFHIMDSLVNKAFEIDAKLAFPLNKYAAEVVYLYVKAENFKSAIELLILANNRRLTPLKLENLNNEFNIKNAINQVFSIDEKLIDSLNSRYKFKFPSFKFIVRGSFSMGGIDDESEKPIHRVTLDSFKIGEAEVTQQQWESIMGKNPSGFHNCTECPVETVSWNDISIYLRNMQLLTGQAYRLPTEAEWEYAAGGGHMRPPNAIILGNNGLTEYSGTFNKNQLEKYAWMESNSNMSTHSVKTQLPNVLGLYDMSGNVWEWCADWYTLYNSDELTNPVGPTSGAGRVNRGGSWENDHIGCRVATRYYYAPDARDNTVGFRLALSL